MGVTEKDIIERIEYDKTTKCCHWTGTSHKHVPVLYKKNCTYYVRSEVYRMRRGPIPRGYRVVMSCGNWDCLQSKHMDCVPVYLRQAEMPL